MFSRLMHRYGTPFTAGLFLVSAISGIALFFHWLPGTFHQMHEWLSMVWLIPFLLHMIKNWKAFLGYLKRKTLLIPIVLSIIAAVPFGWPKAGSGRAGNPAFRVVGMIEQSALKDVAPVFKTTPDALIAHLRQQGFQVSSADVTMQDVAKASSQEAAAVLRAAMSAGGNGAGKHAPGGAPDSEGRQHHRDAA